MPTVWTSKKYIVIEKKSILQSVQGSCRNGRNINVEKKGCDAYKAKSILGYIKGKTYTAAAKKKRKEAR